MTYYSLSSKSKNRYTDPAFIAKAPLVANRYLIIRGAQIAVIRHRESGDLILASDHPQFIERYRNYYEHRFDMQEVQPKQPFQQEDWETVIGQIDLNPAEA